MSIFTVCVCVCVCACMWNKRDVCAFEMRFYFFRVLHTNACTNTSFRAVSIVKLHTIFRTYTTTTIQTIANTIMSTKLTDDTLQQFIVKRPISTMSIHTAFKFGAGSTSERIEIFSATVLHADGYPMTTGAVRWIGIADA